MRRFVLRSTGRRGGGISATVARGSVLRALESREEMEHGANTSLRAFPPSYFHRRDCPTARAKIAAPRPHCVLRKRADGDACDPGKWPWLLVDIAPCGNERVYSGSAGVSPAVRNLYQRLLMLTLMHTHFYGGQGRLSAVNTIATSSKLMMFYRACPRHLTA